jgi:hypothetical protein
MSGSGTGMPPTRTTGAGSAEAQMSMPEDLESLPTQGVGAFIERFAHAHNVSGERTRLDDWTEAVSRAAGDDITLDRVERLLVAVKRLGLINGRQAARLLTNYMREMNVAQRPTPPDA